MRWAKRFLREDFRILKSFDDYSIEIESIKGEEIIFALEILRIIVFCSVHFYKDSGTWKERVWKYIGSKFLVHCNFSRNK